VDEKQLDLKSVLKKISEVGMEALSWTDVYNLKHTLPNDLSMNHFRFLFNNDLSDAEYRVNDEFNKEMNAERKKEATRLGFRPYGNT